jgi:hypothetical protein
LAPARAAVEAGRCAGPGGVNGKGLKIASGFVKFVSIQDGAV